MRAYLEAVRRVFAVFWKLGRKSRRTKVFFLFSQLPMAVALVLRINAAAPAPYLFANVIMFFYLQIIILVLALFYGTSVCSEQVEGRTLPYLTTRPLPRSANVLGKAAAYIALFGRPLGPLPSLYGTFTLLVIAAAAHNLPFAVQAGRSVLGQISNDLEESARLTGAGPLRRMWAIIFPLAIRGLLAGAILVFVKMVRDLSLVVLLFSATSPVLSMVAYRYAAEGFMQFANAITVLILLICLAASLAAQALQARVQKWKD